MADITANELTRYAKDFFKSLGYRINRVNNIPVRRRKGTIEKGWSDLQGYTDKGIYIACEIKKIGDKISPEQMDRLKDVKYCGGKAYICTEDEGKPFIIEFGGFEF
jgi:hypothetical protein